MDVVFLDIDLLVFWDAEAVDGVIEGSGRLMGLDAMQWINLSPFFHLEWVADAPFGPLALFYHPSDEVDELVVIDEAISWVDWVGQVSQFEYFWRGASKDQMGI